MNKVSGGDGISAGLFQILKDDAVKVLHSICQQLWKTQQWLQDWKRSVFISIPKKGNAKECSNYHTIALISHASKVMHKFFQARLQQYLNWKYLDVQAGYRKGRGMRGQIANICWIIEKAWELQKKSTSSLTMLKPLIIWSTTTVEDSSRWEYQTTLSASCKNCMQVKKQTVRIGHGTMDWFKIGKRVRQDYILSPCLFNLYAEYILQNAGLDEAQARIKISGRNFNNLT